MYTPLILVSQYPSSHLVEDTFLKNEEFRHDSSIQQLLTYDHYYEIEQNMNCLVLELANMIVYFILVEWTLLPI